MVPCTVAEVVAPGRLAVVLVDPATGEESTGGAPTDDELAWCARHWPVGGLPVGERVEVGLTRDLAWGDLVAPGAHRHPAGRRLRAHGRWPTHRGHAHGIPRRGPWCAPVPDGSCDLTAHVAVDSLEHDELTTQRAALHELGLHAAHPRPRPGAHRPGRLPRRPRGRLGGGRADRPRTASAASPGCCVACSGCDSRAVVRGTVVGMRLRMPCAPLALALVAGAGLSACGSDTPQEVVVTVTGTPSRGGLRAPAPTPSSTASTKVKAPTSDVEGRRFDFGQVTGAKRAGDVDVLVLDRWTDPKVDDAVRREAGPAGHVVEGRVEPVRQPERQEDLRHPGARGHDVPAAPLRGGRATPCRPARSAPPSSPTRPTPTGCCSSPSTATAGPPAARPSPAADARPRGRACGRLTA